jgi:hypothetical protein
MREPTIALTAALIVLALALPGAAFARNVIHCKVTYKPCQGTPGPDTMYGHKGHDRAINGEGGNDRIFMRGGSYEDGRGGPGNDLVKGQAGIDYLKGGTGNDTLNGGDTRDYLNPEDGRDKVYGGGGGDKIRTRDGQRDVIKCGPKRDRVYADNQDHVSGSCEEVHRK